ncbi:unnamed protein product [Vitrella brassicaformis CCMP3155]|uniref:Tubby C-terminal domain-containing protein n=1 Tax=Vitrella brassicaformis (strain CCMP3155) TaxID=1169540 RepID=A0A0G4EZX0_VITBC|nr:unnamed protein product [Vitrella brassicaformis CCMP3155]|eukprot:CEM05182.1 unnamed protein product [Vitrella brassicaformis CCMP3155]
MMQPDEGPAYAEDPSTTEAASSAAAAWQPQLTYEHDGTSATHASAHYQQQQQYRAYEQAYQYDGHAYADAAQRPPGHGYGSYDGTRQRSAAHYDYPAQAAYESDPSHWHTQQYQQYEVGSVPYYHEHEQPSAAADPVPSPPSPSHHHPSQSPSPSPSPSPHASSTDLGYEVHAAAPTAVNGMADLAADVLPATHDEPLTDDSDAEGHITLVVTHIFPRAGKGGGPAGESTATDSHGHAASGGDAATRRSNFDDSGRDEANPPGTEITMDVYSMSSSAVVRPHVLRRSRFLRKELDELESVRRGETPLEIKIRGRKSFLTVDGVWGCVESLLDVDQQAFNPQSFSGIGLFAVFSAAKLLGLEDMAEACREEICRTLSADTVAVATWLAFKYDDADLLERCYWYLKDLICSHKVPSAWSAMTLPTTTTSSSSSGSGTTGSTGTTVPGASGTRLLEGGLSYRGIRTPMSVFRTVVEQDAIRKKALLKPHSGYLLCQINRTRQDYGGFPHHYVLRNDSDKEPVLWATVRDEHSDVRIFDKEGCCEAFDAHYVGMVEPNFWGTSFVVHDWGVPLYLKKDRLGKQLPMPERKKLLDVKFDTNILGDCPRHIMVTLDRDGEHCEMENIAPKWDPALNSYALPFYGRVKLASAKNFQLVRKGDQNDIMLMFGKISKDVFSLDFRHPLTRLDAFAISIAAMAKKRAVA